MSWDNETLHESQFWAYEVAFAKFRPQKCFPEDFFIGAK